MTIAVKITCELGNHTAEVEHQDYDVMDVRWVTSHRTPLKDKVEYSTHVWKGHRVVVREVT